MNDRKPDLCDSLSMHISLPDSNDQLNEIQYSQNIEKLSLCCKFVKRLKYLPDLPRDACFPFACLDNEETFLRLMSYLRNNGDGVLSEAMYSLDCVDSKSQALLTYISISIAALIFLITGIQNNYLNFMFIDQKQFVDFIYILLIVQSIAMILCLSCVNIIGAHTVLFLKEKDEENRRKEYFNLLKKISLQRRTRYLISHRLSIVSATFLGMLFLLRFTGYL